MRRTIYKAFMVWQYEKEEKWLNQMSAKGLQLCEVGFCRYVFQESTPGEYVYRLEMLDKPPSHIESEQYIRFVEDTGAEQIGSLLQWVYFRKKADGNGFDLFSDLDSRLRHFNRLLTLMGAITGFNLLNLIFQGYTQFILEIYPYPPVNIINILCLFITGILCYGFFSVLSQRRKIKREKILRE